MSRTLLSILANFNSAVIWLVLILPQRRSVFQVLQSSFKGLFYDWYRHHLYGPKFFSFQAMPEYLSSFWSSFPFATTAKRTWWQFNFLMSLINYDKSLFQRILCVIFSILVLAYSIWQNGEISIFCTISVESPSPLGRTCPFIPSNYSAPFTYVTISSLPTYNLHQLLFCVLSIIAMT